MTRNGFTLVELLAAMVAGALLMIGLGWAMAGMTRAFVRDGNAAQPTRVADAGAILATYVERASVPTEADPAVMRPDRLELSAPPPQSLGAIGPVRFAVRTEQSKTGVAVVAQVRQLSGAIPSYADHPSVLLDHLKSAAFEYGAAFDDTGPALPRSITLVVETRDGRTHRLVAVPGIDSVGACKFDPISLTCRN